MTSLPTEPRSTAIATKPAGRTSTPLTDLQSERVLVFKIAAAIGAVCLFALLTAS